MQYCQHARQATVHWTMGQGIVAVVAPDVVTVAIPTAAAVDYL